MRKAHVEAVVGQIDRQLAVGQEAIFFHRTRLMALGLMFPRTKVDFVERYRRIEPLVFLALLHPLAVLPVMAGDVGHDAGRQRAQFECKAVRVGLLYGIGVKARVDGIFIERALPHARREALPDAQVVVSAVHRVGVAVPAVEISDDRDSQRVGRPDGEVDPGHAINLAQMRAHLFIDAVVFSLPKEIEVEIAKHRRHRRASLPYRVAHSR